MNTPPPLFGANTFSPQSRHLFIVRHAVTAYNLAWQEFWDSGGKIKDQLISLWCRRIPDESFVLLPEGVEQARSAGKMLAPIIAATAKRSCCGYVSPYLRTMETAATMSLDRVRWRVVRELSERSWGFSMGMHPDEYFHHFKHWYAMRDKQPWCWAPPGGESLEQIARHLTPVHELVRRDWSENRNVVMVSHHDTIRAMRCVFEHVLPHEVPERTDLSLSNADIVWYYGTHSDRITHVAQTRNGVWDEQSVRCIGSRSFDSDELLAYVRWYDTGKTTIA